jgi:hypothetical protein
MKARDTGSDVTFEPCPIGNHIARCIRVIDLGTHHNEMYDKDRHQIIIMWEIPNETKSYTVKGENGAPDKEVTEPFTVTKFYTLSLAETSHLRPDLESWRSKPFSEEELEGFEMKKLLGVPCMVNVIHKARKQGTGVNAAVTAVTSLPKGIECPPAVHELQFFSLDPEDYNNMTELSAAFDKVSKGYQKQIESSHEWKDLWSNKPAQQQPEQQSESPAPMGADEFDDIPF